MDAFVAAHKRMDVWRRALALAEGVYRFTKGLPRSEQYGLSAQMRRAAVSVLSNISEGAARRSRAEYIQFLYIARGSLAELDAQLTLSLRLGLGSADVGVEAEILRVGQLLNAQIASLRRPSGC